MKKDRQLTFEIMNNCDCNIYLQEEPYGSPLELQPKQNLKIFSLQSNSHVSLNFSQSDTGQPEFQLFCEPFFDGKFQAEIDGQPFDDWDIGDTSGDD